jgi:hypothetical protein
MIKSRRIRWTWNMASLGKKRNAYRIWVGMPEGKKPLLRHKCRWGNNIEIDLTDTG